MAPKKEEEMSEEDRELMEKINLMTERCCDADAGVAKLALETLAHEIRTSTSSMTSVPKPLKYLRPHFDKLKNCFSEMSAGDLKLAFGDVLSVIAMTWGKAGKRECLHFKLQGTEESLGVWGNEYVRCLAGEIGEEYTYQMGLSERKKEDEAVEPMEVEGEEKEKEKVEEKYRDEEKLKAILKMVEEIAPYHLQHNAEAEACDICMEVNKLDILEKSVEEVHHARVCGYLIACASYLPEPEDNETILAAIRLYRKFGKLSEALRMTLKLGRQDLIEEIYNAADSSALQRQMAFMLAAHGVVPHKDEEEMEESEDVEKLAEILSNSMLSEHFLALANELEISEAKTPEDVYKSHLTSGSRVSGSTNQTTDSARKNLASTIVNAFLNAGFGKDKLMLPEDSRWLFMNKDHGMFSAAASVGMLHLWDVDAGLAELDKYLYNKEDQVQAGGLLGIGLVGASVRHEQDPALALLSEHIDSESNVVKVGAIMGLGIAYAGTYRAEVLELLMPIIVNSEQSIEVVSHAALAAGLVYIGTGHDELTEMLMQTLVERSMMSEDLKHPSAPFLSLALGLLYFGLQEESEITIQALAALEGDVQKYTHVTILGCAYAGRGDVLVIQKLLEIVGEISTSEEKPEAQSEEEKKKEEEDPPTYHALAVLSIALVAMGENVGSAMLSRAMDNFSMFGDTMVRRGVPLAIALLNISNPEVSVLDRLSKLSHDANEQVAQCAILGLGLVSAGTNNWRAASMLRNLAEYHARDPGNLFMVRLAQGIVYMGKGTTSISPLHSEGLLTRPTSVAGIIAVLHSMIDVSHTILTSRHYLLYFLALAMRPRMLVTLDENLESVPVMVRVGQALDTIGQPGRGRTITGFQTQTTPCLMAYGEKAELATDEFEPYTSILEGFVVVKKKEEQK